MSDDSETIRAAILNDPAAMGEIADELRALWKAALEREGNLASAVADVMWKATPCATDDEGAIRSYLVPSGTMHRLIGIAQQNGAHVPVSFRAIQPPLAALPDSTKTP